MTRLILTRLVSVIAVDPPYQLIAFCPIYRDLAVDVEYSGNFAGDKQPALKDHYWQY